MRECGRSGYGILTADNKYIRFDLPGSETAGKFLDGVARTTDIRVVVTGTVNGDKMTVQKIELQ